MEKLYCS